MDSSRATKPSLILGIDPGSTSMGFAILEQRGAALRVIEYGTTKVRAKDLLGKLQQIRAQTQELLERHHPHVAGVEALFFAANKKTALEVAQARGAILITLLEHNLPILEFTPPQVKVAVTNYGAADKLMVQKMVMRLLGLEKLTGDDNAADALAIAIATANRARTDSL